MEFQFSSFGDRLRKGCGIVELMDDLGEAMTTHPNIRMMGGGNPAAIPEVQAIWRRRASELLQGGAEFDRMLVNYDPPAGNPAFLKALAGLLSAELRADIKPANIAITNGGQTAFFFLFNMLAGPCADGAHRRILLPLAPEYIGYANQGMGEDIFVAHRALIEDVDAVEFKYRLDLEGLRVGEDTAAICVSRPTNPSGNVLTDREIARLREMARERGIPLIIDNAYGNPFPGAIFVEDANTSWDRGTILTLSLSKLGLPGTRTGIVVADEAVIRAVSSANAVVGLANNNVGQALARPLIESGEILEISRSIIRPYYRERAERAREFVNEAFRDGIPHRVHANEGAFFLWLWFPGLPISSRELYQRLKDRDVLVIPGEYFFYGLDEPWDHSDECIRVTFSQPEKVVREGIEIIAEEVARAYAP